MFPQCCSGCAGIHTPVDIQHARANALPVKINDAAVTIFRPMFGSDISRLRVLSPDNRRPILYDNRRIRQLIGKWRIR